MKNKIVLKLIICFALILTFCSLFFFEKQIYFILNKNIATTERCISECDLKIHFIDCGQAESIAINLPNNEIMLIDCGLEENVSDLIDYLTKYVTNDKVIDHFVISHPHSDHMGGYKQVFDKFDIKKFYTPKVTTGVADDETDFVEEQYNNLINQAINECNHVNYIDYKFEAISGDDFCIEFLSPFDVVKSVNDFSSIMMLTYNNKKIIFTGDAEEDSERKVLNYYQTKLSDADILKVGHHGSKTSSCSDFVNSLSPDYAIISCGRYNQYYHPHSSVVKKYEAIGSKIFTTDTNGNIVCGINNKGEVYFTYEFNNRMPTRILVWQVVLVCIVITCSLVFIVKIDNTKKKLLKIKK